MQELDSVSMAELMLVPTSAQPSLSRPARCADLCEKFVLSPIRRRNAVGIFTSLHDGRKRVGDAISAELLRAIRLGAVGRRRF
jgi:hypothetical protein